MDVCWGKGILYVWLDWWDGVVFGVLLGKGKWLGDFGDDGVVGCFVEGLFGVGEGVGVVLCVCVGNCGNVGWCGVVVLVDGL